VELKSDKNASKAMGTHDGRTSVDAKAERTRGEPESQQLYERPSIKCEGPFNTQIFTTVFPGVPDTYVPRESDTTGPIVKVVGGSVGIPGDTDGASRFMDSNLKLKLPKGINPNAEFDEVLMDSFTLKL
jgi:hypothetical protein